ncbi:MAG: adenylate/guanylate cyclase domain-containing protein [Hyphomonadaceae bacterium]
MTEPVAPVLTAASLPRRLATIVSIDAAGYSRQSEVDEASTVREIKALAERIRASAASRHGRVFNTAGDGFMLEFPSVSAAVASAEELQSVDRVPLRIGVHVGEVHETETGDLLGRGVNIAARLMALAEPGDIVLSADVKQALAADVTARLVGRRVVRLAKMNERLETYRLTSAWRGAPPALFARLRESKLIVATLTATIGLLAAWLASQTLFGARDEQIAVLEFRALDDPGLAGFAAGLADRIVGVMSGHDLKVAAHTLSREESDRVAAASRDGAAFVLDGSVRRDGADLLVSARLVDANTKQSLWSNEYRRVAEEGNYFQEQISAEVARVLRCALVSRRIRAGPIDDATLSIFLRACDRAAASDSAESRYEAARQVTERAPRFSGGWSLRAMSAAEMSFWTEGQAAESFRAEVRSAAARARELDANNGESYLAELELVSWRDWRARQAILDQALRAEPELASVHLAQGELLASLGRHREALASYRRAAALDPLSSENWSASIPLLSAVGSQAQADEMRERFFRVWPNSPGGWYNRFFNASHNGNPAEALRMLDAMESAPVRFEQRARELWGDYLRAQQSGDRNRIRHAALAMLELTRGRQFNPFSIAAVLAEAGELDASFAMLQEIYQSPRMGTDAIFNTPYAELRREPRFMIIARDAGLIQYWRETGRWPDFCADRDLPYNCEQEAARILPL